MASSLIIGKPFKIITKIILIRKHVYADVLLFYFNKFMSK